MVDILEVSFFVVGDCLHYRMSCDQGTESSPVENSCLETGYTISIKVLTVRKFFLSVSRNLILSTLFCLLETCTTS